MYGCAVDNALFCFPCLLFGGDKAWTVSGQKDLGNLNAKATKHASSPQHLNHVADLSMLEQSNIASFLDSRYALSIARHNDEVQKIEIPFRKLSIA